LQWTFNGVLVTPSWEFGTIMGGWVVEKSTGYVFLGQGFNLNGFQVMRINNNGIYDNYITTASINFLENWKMLWNCNNGNPQILILGGGGTSNINIGVLSPPSTSISSLNITAIPFIPPAGLNSGINQDIVDAIINPQNNELHTIFNSFGGTPSVNNKLYKNSPPYSATSILWNVPSGFSTLTELKNRPYLQPDANGLTDNSANIFALNSNYLFYWDGKNLKAFNKVTGASVGTPYITSNTAKMCGGIYADACNNVYIGSVNGTIKVYNFNGSIFDDAPTDITVAGYTTKSVYDIAYNEADKLLYAGGDGFVAAYDISATCPTNNVGFSLNIVANCTTASATANLVPSAPTSSQVSYTLAIGSTVVATNSTGIFTGLLSLTNYKITATINPACSGIQVIGNFTLAGIAAPIVTTPIIYCQGATATALTATGTNLQWYTYNCYRRCRYNNCTHTKHNNRRHYGILCKSICNGR
jgi:hypothetical protein